MRTSRQIISGIAAVASLMAVLGVVKYMQISAAIAQSQAMAKPPEAVTSFVVEPQRWEATIQAVGSLEASKGTVLAAEGPGKVAKVLFESGDLVEAGKVLVELDTTVEEANMKAAEALRDEARKTLGRMDALKASKAVSQREYDAALAKYREMQSELESMESTMTRKKIISPYAGRLGIRKVNIGQFVAAGTEIVPLYALDPLYVNFSVPQSGVSSVKLGSKVKLSTDAFPGEEFQGELTAINPQIDPATRMVELQATLANPQERLRPGMFAEVTIVLPSIDEVLAIPSSSVSFAPYGDTVYVIENAKGPDGQEIKSVRQQVVRLGRKLGDFVAVSEGLKRGDEVVSTGSFKLRPGAAVSLHNESAPKVATKPSPQDT